MGFDLNSRHIDVASSYGQIVASDWHTEGNTLMLEPACPQCPHEPDVKAYDAFWAMLEEHYKALPNAEPGEVVPTAALSEQELHNQCLRVCLQALVDSGMTHEQVLQLVTDTLAELEGS